MIKVIVFDGEGTLFLSLPKARKIKNILEAEGHRRTLADIGRAFVLSKRIANLLRSKGPMRLDEQGYLLENEIRLMLLGFSDKEAPVLARTINARWTEAGHRTPYPETKIVLKSLKRRGYRLGLLTAGAILSYRETLKETGLSGYFSFIIGEDTLNVPKPDPRAYRYVIRKAGCEPGEILFVGDNLKTAYEGAIKSGMRAVLVSRKSRSNGLIAEISSLKPLAAAKFFEGL